jgi:ABC-type nitrate/sulfonate/bicarbonate transport system permease component
MTFGPLSAPPPRWKLGVLSLAGFVTFFGAWYLTAHAALVPAAFLPSPEVVLKELVRITHEPFVGYTIQQHLASSLSRFALGFGIAVVVGVPLGLMMGWSEWLDSALTPLFNALRFVAPVAWVPFAALWFGTGFGGPGLIIFTGAFPPALINAYRGAKLVDRRLVEAAQTLGARTPHIIRHVLLPGSVPSIIAGLRVSAGLGWQSLIGAELIVASSGIGYLIVKGQTGIRTATVISGMIAIGMVGFIIDALLRRLEVRIYSKRGGRP